MESKSRMECKMPNNTCKVLDDSDGFMGFLE